MYEFGQCLLVIRMHMNMTGVRYDCECECASTSNHCTWMDVRSSYLTVGLSFSLRHVTDGDPILLGRHGMPGRDACNCDGGSRPRMRQPPFRNVRLNGLKP